MIPLSRRSRIMDHDEQLTCLRQTGVTYVNGMATPAGSQVFVVRCNVQPLTGRELLMLPEGDRETESLWIWVPQTAGQTMVQNADFVARAPYVYRITMASNWGSYTQARMVRQTQGGPSLSQFVSQSN